MKKQDYKNIIILFTLGLLIILSIFIFGSMFGSNMDWINQHTVIPEYFRQYFYENKKLIPDIIYNLGLGENAFNFSYYGLLSPIILISYLLPFVNMTTYIMETSIILYLLSIYLFYKFLRPKFDIKLTTLLTLIFMCASPILFQFHRQIMFVNYLPFLIMALINIDNYDKRKSKIFLILNLLGMIFSSYYFSVSGILVILIYYIYLNYNKPLKEKNKILIPILISILISGVLLIPSLFAILNNRGIVNESINILNLLIPNFNYSSILYGSYALGLSSIAIISIMYLTLKKGKSFKFLGICILILITFPIFRYLLNGGLYIRSKVLIPFIPIIILAVGILLKDLFDRKIDFKKIIIGIIVLSILGLFNFNLLYYLDLIVTVIFLGLYYKFDKKYIIVIPIIILSVATLIIGNLGEEYITREEYQSLSENTNLINNLTNKDSGIYRISELENTLYNVNRGQHYKTSVYSSTVNSNYQKFYYDILRINNNNYNNLIIRDTDNIIFNKLMGVKYVISDSLLGNGYSKIDSNIYQNDYALSLGYASSEIYSLDKFNQLGYPYNLKYLLNGIVVDSNNSYDTDDIIEKYDFDLLSKIGNIIPLEKENNSYYLKLDSDKNFMVNLDNTLENKLLFIEIKGLESNSCLNDDISITINNNENSLSCTSWLYHNKNYTFNYLINDKILNELDIAIKKGIYKINSINLYTMDIKYLNNNFDEITSIKINDNEITGTIDVTNDGYMTFSIPYDKNFKVFVDGKAVEIERVNTSFIGFKINKGIHDLKVIYNSPGLMTGKITSLFGLLSFVIYLIVLLKINTRFAKIK